MLNDVRTGGRPHAFPLSYDTTAKGVGYRMPALMIRRDFERRTAFTLVSHTHIAIPPAAGGK